MGFARTQESLLARKFSLRLDEFFIDLEHLGGDGFHFSHIIFRHHDQMGSVAMNCANQRPAAALDIAHIQYAMMERLAGRGQG